MGPEATEVTGATARCNVCPRGCVLAPGQVGACRARGNRGEAVVPLSYGRVTSLAVDPVEKKPLARWRSGSRVLSLGSYGCNLRCSWCQNHGISQVGEDGSVWRTLGPDEVAALAVRLHAEDPRMVGVAYTYNEPLVSWEYVRDCSVAIHEAGLENVLVSAGCVSEAVMRAVAPLTDAANIDLKAFSRETYRRVGGDLDAVRRSIEILAAEPTCHVEVTTLVVPGVNDADDEIDALASWLASVDPEITLHVTRFFPAWRMRDRAATPVGRVYALADVARRHLVQVRVGNC